MELFEFAGVSIFVAQQLGVVLGVGAQTILLVTHLLAVHGADHGVDVAAKKARGAGLALIALSGAGAVGFHLASGTVEILLEPAFLFKWALIFALFLTHVFEARFPPLAGVVEGFAGATWYALFLVHTLAPVTGWENLLILYAAWVALFTLVWAGFTLLMHGAKPFQTAKSQPVPQKPVERPAPAVKPLTLTQKLPIPTPKPAPQTVLPVAAHILLPKPEIMTERKEVLPHIRVMPQTPAEINKHYGILH